jgi:hypothetical protein
MYIRVYRLEIQSVMLIFSTQLCELEGEGEVLRLRQINTCRKVPLQDNFLDDKKIGVAFYESYLSTF